MGLLKEIYENLTQRIRSPFFGSFIVSFLVTNWAGVYFLLFSETAADTRINYFVANTSLTSLLCWPLAAALAYVLVGPWIKGGLVWWADKPRAWIDKIETSAKASREIFANEEKARLEQSEQELLKQRTETIRRKEELEAEVEKNETAAAERRKNASEIGDQIAKEMDDTNHDDTISLLKQRLVEYRMHTELLKWAAKSKTGKFGFDGIQIRIQGSGQQISEYTVSDHRETVDIEDALKALIEVGLLVNSSHERYEMTSLGYRYLDSLSNKD